MLRILRFICKTIFFIKLIYKYVFYLIFTGILDKNGIPKKPDIWRNLRNKEEMKKDMMTNSDMMRMALSHGGTPLGTAFPGMDMSGQVPPMPSRKDLKQGSVQQQQQQQHQFHQQQHPQLPTSHAQQELQGQEPLALVSPATSVSNLSVSRSQENPLKISLPLPVSEGMFHNLLPSPASAPGSKPTGVLSHNPNMMMGKPLSAPATISGKPRSLPQPIMTPPPAQMSPNSGVQPQRPQSVQLPVQHVPISSPDIPHSHPQMQQILSSAVKDSHGLVNKSSSAESKHPEKGYPQLGDAPMFVHIPPGYVAHRIPGPQAFTFPQDESQRHPGAGEPSRGGVKESHGHSKPVDASRHAGPEGDHPAGQTPHSRPSQMSPQGQTSPHGHMSSPHGQLSPHGQQVHASYPGKLMRHPITGELVCPPPPGAVLHMRHPGPEMMLHPSPGEQIRAPGPGQPMPHPSPADSARHQANSQRRRSTEMRPPSTDHLRQLGEQIHRTEMFHRMRAAEQLPQHMEAQRREEQLRMEQQMRHLKSGEQPPAGGDPAVSAAHLRHAELVQIDQQRRDAHHNPPKDSRQELQKLAHSPATAAAAAAAAAADRGQTSRATPLSHGDAGQHAGRGAPTPAPARPLSGPGPVREDPTGHLGKHPLRRCCGRPSTVSVAQECQPSGPGMYCLVCC